MQRTTFTPKITPFRGPILELNYLPHFWTNPTYHPKLYSYLIISFATMHWTDSQTLIVQQMFGGNVR